MRFMFDRDPLRRWFVFGICLAMFSCSLSAQDTPAQSPADKPAGNVVQEPAGVLGATIKGKIVVEEGIPIAVDLATIEIAIVEQISFEPLPLPDDWGTKTDEQQRQWIKEFQESEAGQQFKEERESRMKNQRRLPVKMEADGSFEVYDVPPGTYNLFGRKDVDAEGKKFAVEVFGQFTLKLVDELELDPLPVAVTRLLSAGEAAPEISVDSLQAGGNKITLSQFQGRPVLIFFWTTNDRDIKTVVEALKEAYAVVSSELKLEILGICIDEAPDKALEFVAAEQLPWAQGQTAGWGHPVFSDYGVRGVPAYFLVGADGKLLLSNSEFYRELSRSTSDLATVLRDKVSGGK